jgi:hypothetical protein
MDDVTISFYHPDIGMKFPKTAPDNTLLVHTGANQIKWAYSMNTTKFPTYGGEVIQVLSARVGQLHVGGNTVNNLQLAAIYKWFRAYMTLAGATRPRDVTPITFQYPNRGWELGIYVTAAPSFKLGTTQVATEWSIVAEVNQEDAQLLEHEIMKPLTYPLTTVLGDSAGSLVLPKGIGFIPNNKFSAPLPDLIAKGASPDAIAAATQRLQTVTANNIGNSFEALVAAWSGGDFAHFLFDATQGASANGLGNPDDVWQRLYNSPFVDGSNNQTGGTPAPGGGTYNTNISTAYPGDGATKLQIALWIGANCLKNGIPPEVGICAAAGESDFNPTEAPNRAGATGLFQVIPAFHPPNDVAYWQVAQHSLDWFLAAAQKVKGSYPSLAEGDLTERVSIDGGLVSGEGSRLNWWIWLCEKSATDNALNEYYAKQATANTTARQAIAQMRAAPTTTGGGGPVTGNYVSPFSTLGGYGPFKFIGVDEGTDWSGAGPIYAIGDALITNVEPQNSGTGWPGAAGDGTGSLMCYQLLGGSKKGAYIYLAENCDPVSGLLIGMHVKAGEQIATARGSYPYIETGWAVDAHGKTLARAHGDHPTKPPHPTADGQTFYDFVKTIIQGGGNATPSSVRDKIVQWANYGIEHSAAIFYDDNFNLPPSTTLTSVVQTGSPKLDCVTFTCLVYKAAGAPDPTGGGFGGLDAIENTDHLLSHCDHITLTQAKVGDIVVFGPLWSGPGGFGHHAAILLEDGNGGNPYCASHGEDAGPVRVRLQDEIAHQTSRGHPGVAFLRCPGLD